MWFTSSICFACLYMEVRFTLCASKITITGSVVTHSKKKKPKITNISVGTKIWLRYTMYYNCWVVESIVNVGTRTVAQIVTESSSLTNIQDLATLLFFYIFRNGNQCWVVDTWLVFGNNGVGFGLFFVGWIMGF